jgi:hypothetical protein
VSGGVVADEMNIKLSGHLTVYLSQESEPFLMAMTSGSVSEDLAGQIIQCSKQSDRSMAVVIVPLGADMALTQGQAGLATLKGLALALFIAAEHERAMGRLDIETHHVPELLCKGQILGELERTHAMRSDRMRRPKPMHVDLLNPVSCAIARTLQRPPCGARLGARLKARPFAFAESRGLRPRPGASSRPAKPIRLQRPRHLLTEGGLVFNSLATERALRPCASPRIIRLSPRRKIISRIRAC